MSARLLGRSGVTGPTAWRTGAGPGAAFGMPRASRWACARVARRSSRSPSAARRRGSHWRMRPVAQRRGACGAARPVRQRARLERRRSRGGGVTAAPLGQRHHLALADDQVVEHPHVDQRQRALERLRQELVGARGLRDAGRVVVREDHGRRVQRQRALDHLARVDAGLRQRAVEHLLQRASAGAGRRGTAPRRPRACARRAAAPRSPSHAGANRTPARR